MNEDRAGLELGPKFWPDELDGFAEEVTARKLEEARVLVSKQMDYGAKNIAACPVGPELGLVVRIFDKVARAANLVQSGRVPENEAMTDTALDVANYGTILGMVVDGVWPSE